MKPILFACAVLAAASLPAQAALTYDAWAWLVWGRELAALDLDLGTPLPAWKPLPVLLTMLLSPFGNVTPVLWMFVARMGALLAVALTYRIACRLAGRLAGAVAAAAVMVSAGMLDDLALQGVSEPLLAALVLWAVDSHLDRRPDLALVAGVAAALLRPEVWPFLGLYAAFLWRADPGRRVTLALLVSSVPILWFGPDLLVAGKLQRSFEAGSFPTGAGVHGAPASTVLEAAARSLSVPVMAGVVVAVVTAVATFTRPGGERRTLMLAAIGAAWLTIVAAMAELGIGAGVARFLIVSSVMAAVLAGVGWASSARAAGALAVAVSGRPQLAGPVGALFLAVGVLAAGALFPTIRLEERAERAEVLEFAAKRYRELPLAVARAGGSGAVLACGRPSVNASLRPSLAWHLHTHMASIDEVRAGEPARGMVFLAQMSRESTKAVIAPAGFRVVARTTYWLVAARCSPLKHRFQGVAVAAAGASSLEAINST